VVFHIGGVLKTSGGGHSEEGVEPLTGEGGNFFLLAHTSTGDFWGGLSIQKVSGEKNGRSFFRDAEA